VKVTHQIYEIAQMKSNVENTQYELMIGLVATSQKLSNQRERN